MRTVTTRTMDALPITTPIMLSAARSLCWARAFSAIFNDSPGRRSNRYAAFIPRLFLRLCETTQAIAGAVPIRLQLESFPVLDHCPIAAVERLIKPPEPLKDGRRGRPRAA